MFTESQLTQTIQLNKDIGQLEGYSNAQYDLSLILSELASEGKLSHDLRLTIQTKLQKQFNQRFNYDKD